MNVIIYVYIYIYIYVICIYMYICIISVLLITITYIQIRCLLCSQTDRPDRASRRARASVRVLKAPCSSSSGPCGSWARLWRGTDAPPTFYSGSFTVEKTLSFCKFQGFLTNQAKSCFVIIRNVKRFLTNEAPANVI